MNPLNFELFKKQITAFSLVELLMALLVASLLMAALAPVMTRKMSENVNVKGVGDIYKAPADMQCYTYSDSNPSVNVSINDVYSASFIISSAGGGGAGATSTNKVVQTPIQITGTTTSDTTQEIIITEYMTDVKATLVGAGGGGGGGAGYIENCNDSFQTSDLRGLCVTKKNHHDNNVNNGTGCWDNYFMSNGEVVCDSKNTGYVYSGCRRAVCTYAAAKNACSTIGSNWRLPKYNEMLKWNQAAIWQRLGLCSAHANSAVSWCGGGILIGGTPGHPAWADPHRVWAESSSCPAQAVYGCTFMLYNNSNISTNAATGSGHYGDSNTSYYINSKHSLRCVRPSYTIYAAGGGGSGAMLKDIDISEYVKQAGIGGKIRLVAGKGGEGGVTAGAKNIKASDGNIGGNSLIFVQKKIANNQFQTIKAFSVVGGPGGKGGDASAGTPGSDTAAAQYCVESNDGVNWTQISCSKNGYGGVGGVHGVGSVPKAGRGAHSAYNDAGGGIGANTDSTTGNGSNAANSAYGAGGGGGTAIYTSGDTITAGKGGNGAGGLVKITYSNEYAASPGGGGGGGTIAQIKDVQLGRQAECTLTMGKGGKGGSVDNDGLDGGSSSVKCNTDTRTFTVPGGKGGKKGSYATSSVGSNAIPVIGKGGEYGNIKNGGNSAINAVRDYNSSKKVISEGVSGEDGVYNQTSKISIGGRGGKSGTGTFGGCGGLYTEDDDKKGICKVSITDLKRAEGKGFKYEETITPNANELSTSFGISGAGGGGGGWEREIGSAKGGDGMNGYVCVYWYNTD